MNELGAALQWLLDAFETWLQCVARPVPTLNRILLEATDDEQLSAAGKVWAPSQLITLIISFPILKLYGIEWNDLGYHLCNWLTTIVVLIIFAFTAHKLLLALQLKSQFVQTLVIYTVIVTTYSPITTLLSIPSTLTLFAAVQNFKQHPIAIDKAVMVYFSSFSNTTSFYANTIGVLSIFTQVFSFGIQALFAECVSQWYRNDRFKCYSSVVVSLLLSVFIVMLVTTPVQLFIIYAFMKATPG